MGYHPNARVELSHSSSMSRMGRNEGWMMLFSPKVFQVGASGNSGVGVVVHTGKVGDDETIGKVKSG